MAQFGDLIPDESTPSPTKRRPPSRSCASAWPRCWSTSLTATGASWSCATEIGGEQPQTLDQVAKLFGLTRELRQIEDAALRKLSTLAERRACATPRRSFCDASHSS